MTLKTELTDRDRLVFHGLFCPKCECKTELVDSSEIYTRDYGTKMWRCPQCGATVGCHKGTMIALGRVADKHLRELKIKAHASFDRLWKSRRMTRVQAYSWLAEQLGKPREFTHIGWFDEELCNKVIDVVNEYYGRIAEVDGRDSCMVK